MENTSSNIREVDWLDLPLNLVSVISEKLLIHIQDYIRFGAVCRPWRFVYIENHHRCCLRPPRRLPMLMIGSVDPQTHSFYDIIDKKVYNSSLVTFSKNKGCCSSSEGWLIKEDEKSIVHLINPFLSVNNNIELPVLPYLEYEGVNLDGFLIKAVLSANPLLSPNFIVMAIYGELRALAFYKSGDSAWTSLGSEYTDIEDVIYCRDRFYAVDFDGILWACNVNTPHNIMSKIAPQFGRCNHKIRTHYIVESLEDLLQVIKVGYRGEYGVCPTIGFIVFKLDLVELKWFEVMNLSGQTLFLGENTSLSLLASDYPQCRPNSIYYTDVNFVPSKRVHDVGVFNFENGTIELYHELKGRIFSPPIWIEPTLDVSSLDQKISSNLLISN
ncbi:hypothetical protein AQUCO_01900018v1 [Aquilegia coerulea]|uniref:KIB1-4 beta-propeller domain-containing protein n=1 Tax=Aquilegia coerulea TaxID=218851 RepID=A0A2G5DIK3_AQUCA|nr:hypothetical protein AQUCO_01900018v1 [Aquilegia coerulea]